MKSTVFYKRTTCRLCESWRVEKICSFPEVPLAEKYFTEPTKVPKAPVDLYWCHDCRHVQQLDVVYPQYLWDEYIFNPMQKMKDHFIEFSKTVPGVGLIVDIGSNDGSLLRPFKDRGWDVLGIEANQEIADRATKSGIPTLAGMFRGLEVQADVVTAFNVFAHNDDLDGMLKNIKKMLKPTGRFIFEAQYLVDILDKTLFPTLFHEHLSHHSVTALNSWFKRNGMRLIHVDRNDIQHGSIIGTVVFEDGIETDSTVTDLLWLEQDIGPSTLRRFGGKVERMKGKEFYECGYGAAHSGPTIMSLLGFEVGYIIDDHPQKVGKFAGTIPVLPTSRLLENQPDETFILAWVHQRRIIENNQEYIDRGGRFYTSISS